MITTCRTSPVHPSISPRSRAKPRSHRPLRLTRSIIRTDLFFLAFWVALTPRITTITILWTYNGTSPITSTAIPTSLQEEHVAVYESFGVCRIFSLAFYVTLGSHDQRLVFVSMPVYTTLPLNFVVSFSLAQNLLASSVLTSFVHSPFALADPGVR